MLYISWPEMLIIALKLKYFSFKADLLVLLGNSVTAARVTLNHLVKVRILVPQFL